MGLHVFFGCYYQLFDLMEKVGALSNLRLKQHTHTFINRGGKVGELDFRFFTGAPLNGLKAFFTTSQLSLQDKVQNAIALGTSPLVRGLIDFEGAMKTIRHLDSVSFADWFRRHGGSDGSIKRLWNPIAYALGFIDCENISARCMLTIFQFFAAKTEASILRMLEGSPHEYLHKPIINYLEARGTKIYTRRRVREVLFVGENNETRVTGIKVADGETEETITADAYICACDVPGIQRLLPPAWRQWSEFDNIYKLEAVPVATVQLRFDGWVTELADGANLKTLQAQGIDNLLYTADADFSCFADLALTSPGDYYREGQGSLLQLVLTPGDPFIKESNEAIALHVLNQVRELFPSAKELNVTWSSVVKLAQSLYRESPGTDPFRPPQKTPIANFFLAGSYTQQDYIDSMEGATISGRQAAKEILASK
jgi:zeta-carotene desaturase